MNTFADTAAASTMGGFETRPYRRRAATATATTATASASASETETETETEASTQRLIAPYQPGGGSDLAVRWVHEAQQTLHEAGRLGVMATSTGKRALPGISNPGPWSMA